jgi:hypothetical protein
MLYHVTILKNLSFILNEGLLPKIGENSIEFGETVPRIYLFDSKESCENGLMNWLGECFENVEDGELVILGISPEGIDSISEVEYELAVSEGIPASSIIQVFDENFNKIDF